MNKMFDKIFISNLLFLNISHYWIIENNPTFISWWYLFWFSAEQMHCSSILQMVYKRCRLCFFSTQTFDEPTCIRPKTNLWTIIKAPISLMATIGHGIQLVMTKTVCFSLSLTQLNGHNTDVLGNHVSLCLGYWALSILNHTNNVIFSCR